MNFLSSTMPYGMLRATSFFVVRIVQRLFVCVERLPNMSHSVKLRTHEIISNSMIASRFHDSLTLRGSAVRLNVSGL